MTLQCQELVIGSGPAGAITAALLAEAGRDTIVAEEGAEAPDPPPQPYSLEELSQRYRYRGLNPAFGSPKTAYVEGCCVGGGSEINSGLYHRAPDDVLERWSRERGVVDAGPEHLAAHFDAVEESVSVCGSPGPAPAPSRKLQQGAAELGWKCIETQRLVQYCASEPHPDGSPAAVRITMTKTWLPRARAAGARVLSRFRIVRLERGGSGWIATAAGPDGPVTIRAGHVFLCCGAVQTPLLLRRIGLRRHVGNSLAMHPMVKVVALFDDQVNYEGLGVPFYQVKEFAPRVTFGSSISSRPHLAMAMLDHPEAQRRVLDDWQSAAVYYASLTGAPTGKIRRVPFTDDPVVGYSVSSADRRELAAAVVKLCRLLLRAGAKELFTPLTPGVGLRSETDCRRIPEMVDRRTTLTSIHLFCSCPMGGEAKGAAVDSWGQLWDAPALSIHDGSIFCDAPGVNPQGTVMAFARRNTLRYLSQA
jgi:choline dehydrogenase-like flavoprotein